MRTKRALFACLAIITVLCILARAPAVASDDHAGRVQSADGPPAHASPASTGVPCPKTIGDRNDSGTEPVVADRERSAASRMDR